EQIANRRRRPERLLGGELDDLGQGLHEAERPDSVRAVAVLKASEELALVDDDDRQDREDHTEDHKRLEDLHPPRLDVADGCECDHGLRTSTTGSVRAFAESTAIPVARNAVPAGTAERTAARAPSRVPFCDTVTSSPSSIPSRCASWGESSTCWAGSR